MGSTKPVYLVSIHGGGVVTQQANRYPGGVVMEYAGVKDDEQKWIPEFGEEPNIVALRSVSNNEYLSGSGAMYNVVGTSEEKTWWTMLFDDMRAPSAFRLCADRDQKKHCIEVQSHSHSTCRLLEMDWRLSAKGVKVSAEYLFAFYFVDADWSSSSVETRIGASDREATSAKLEKSIATKQKALEDREAALDQKEKAASEQEAAANKQESDNAAKEKALKEREAALAQKEKDSAAKQKAIVDREAALAQQEKEFSSSKKAFEDREAAFNQKEKDYSSNKKAADDSEAAWKSQQQNSAAGEKGLESRKAALVQQEKALKNREITLEQHEKESAAGKRIFEHRKAALAQREKDFSADKKSLGDREATLTEKENKRAAEWDKKMKELQALREAAAQLKKSYTGNQVGCGSKHYKPPRKLNRKIIGLVYE